MEYKITALKAQKRNPKRVNIYLDGEYAFGLERVVAGWLSVGQIIDDEKIAKLQDKDTYETALQKALHFLSYRPRSEQEVRKKLLDKDVPEPIIEAVIERLKQLDFICDVNFAQMWVENRSTFRPRSHRQMAYELRQKGVSEEDIRQALDKAEDEETLAYKAAQKYCRRLEGLEWNEFRKKLTGYLGRRGFFYGVVEPIVKKLWAEQHPS